MDNYGKNKKRYVFYMTDDDHARFEILLLEDKIKKTKFFREFIGAYVNGDPLIRQWIEQNPNIQISQRTKSIRKREAKKQAIQSKDFNLDGKDVSEIFDILAEAEND